MDTPALLLSLALGLICCFVITGGAATLIALVRGVMQVRRACAVFEAENPLLKSSLVPPVAVIAAPRDGSPESRRYVKKLLGLHAADAEVVVVLDDPSDVDRAAWIEEFGLAPAPWPIPNPVLKTKPIRAVYESPEPIRLIVAEKERGGEADCLNAAINLTGAALLATVDQNTCFSDRALSSLLAPMMVDLNRTIAVCAAGPLPLQSAGLVARLQRVQLLQTWLCRCAALSGWNALLPSPGSFLLLRRDAIIDIQGFSGSLLETVIHLHGMARAMQVPYVIRLAPRSLSWPRTPESWAEEAMISGRNRYDLKGALANYTHLLMGFGSLGWLGIPVLLWEGFLRPVLEIAALVLALFGAALGWVSPALLAIAAASTIGLGMLLSMTAVILEPYATMPVETVPQGLVSLFFSAVAESLGYRQWCNIRAVGSLLRRRNSSI
jgi:cellulose synthase/poly-beta-1,6-N-acetylglucosamine synthase-like glycosyltransferase